MLETDLHNHFISELKNLENQLAETVPFNGTFPKVCCRSSFNYQEYLLNIELAIGSWEQSNPNSSIKNWQEMRYVELKVSTQNHECSSTWIYNGTKEELQKTFQSKETMLPYIEKIFKSSIEHLQRDFNL